MNYIDTFGVNSHFAAYTCWLAKDLQASKQMYGVRNLSALCWRHKAEFVHFVLKTPWKLVRRPRATHSGRLNFWFPRWSKSHSHLDSSFNLYVCLLVCVLVLIVHSLLSAICSASCFLNLLCFMFPQSAQLHVFFQRLKAICFASCFLNLLNFMFFFKDWNNALNCNSLFFGTSLHLS